MEQGAVTRTEHRVRLQVVLDLDHTLLQAAVAPEGGSSSHHARHLHTFTLRGSVDKPRTDTRYLLGLRDGLNEFLQQVEKLATVHVYTMGSKSYATEVVAIIDPTKELIKGRVLCRMDSAPDAFTKSLSHLFPDEERRSSALVLDDRVDAWDPPSREQLIQVPAFRCFGDDGSSYAHALPEPDSPDVTLMAMLRVIRAVHMDWSHGAAPSVAESLRSQRQKVLKGTSLVFSGGLHDPARGPIEREHYWLLARACGAKCEKSMDRATTHVVSGKPDSNGVKRARSHEPHMFAVSPKWLEESAHRWCRQSEAPYALPEPRPIWAQAAAAAAAAAQPDAVMERALRAMTERIPESLNNTQRLKAAIKYIVPAQRRPRVLELFRRFDTLQHSAREMTELMQEITELVGQQELKSVMIALDIPG